MPATPAHKSGGVVEFFVGLPPYPLEAGEDIETFLVGPDLAAKLVQITDDPRKVTVAGGGTVEPVAGSDVAAGVAWEDIDEGEIGPVQLIGNGYYAAIYNASTGEIVDCAYSGVWPLKAGAAINAGDLVTESAST